MDVYGERVVHLGVGMVKVEVGLPQSIIYYPYTNLENDMGEK